MVRLGREAVRVGRTPRVMWVHRGWGESVAESLAMALTLRTVAWPRLVYDGSALVAFVMAFHTVEWTGDPSGVTRSGLWASTRPLTISARAMADLPSRRFATGPSSPPTTPRRGLAAGPPGRLSELTATGEMPYPVSRPASDINVRRPWSRAIH